MRALGCNDRRGDSGDHSAGGPHDRDCVLPYSRQFSPSWGTVEIFKAGREVGDDLISVRPLVPHPHVPGYCGPSSIPCGNAVSESGITFIVPEVGVAITGVWIVFGINEVGVPSVGINLQIDP